MSENNERVEIPQIPIQGLFSRPEGGMTIEAVEHLEKLVDSIVTMENIELRSKISKRLMIHLLRAKAFARAAKESGYIQTAGAMNGFIMDVLALSTSVEGWNVANLIKALSAARNPFYSMSGGVPGQVGYGQEPERRRGISRVLGGR